ncbi:MAG: copper resistance system multicopper oxidase [Pseudomonadota bacterium]
MYPDSPSHTRSRRRFLHHSLLGCAAACLPAWARAGANAPLRGISPVSSAMFQLDVREKSVVIDKQIGRAICINDQLPAPLLRWREGDQVTLAVTNHLAVDTSIHWHGILLPPEMDGVPGVSFAGIKPGETFTYQFPVAQAGTYWYHSHSGLQEQAGHYGPIVIDPAGPDPVQYDREHLVVLSDWTFEDPHHLFAKLKKSSDVYNYQQRTVVEFFSDLRKQGLKNAWRNRTMWGAMRMNPADIADVTGSAYTYLINGHGPAANWTCLFEPGERVRLRFINAAAMSIFNVRIPGLPMQIVQADGLNVRPVEVDEFQIGVAETFDVIVKPEQDRAFTIFAEGNDRSGFARATLATKNTSVAEVPKMRPTPRLSMRDMAMDHSDHGHTESHAHHGGDTTRQMQEHQHPHGPGVVGLAARPTNRLAERPVGLEAVDHRVLVYTDLKSLDPNPDPRAPARELELHLTSNMERYMWSFDGVKFSEVDGPIEFTHGERLRLTLVNDTMMPHPIHLHGMFFDVVTRNDRFKPRKHTIVVKPGEKLSVDITANALGDWAFHCHLLYHMHAGMMRVVSVREPGGAAPS